MSGQRNAIQIAVHGCIDVGVVREVVAGDECFAVDGLSPGHDTRLREVQDASGREGWQRFSWTDGEGEATPWSRLRGSFDGDKEEFSTRRPSWLTVACAYPERGSTVQRNCQGPGNDAVAIRIGGNRHQPLSCGRNAAGRLRTRWSCRPTPWWRRPGWWLVGCRPPTRSSWCWGMAWAAGTLSPCSPPPPPLTELRLFSGDTCREMEWTDRDIDMLTGMEDVALVHVPVADGEVPSNAQLDHLDTVITKARGEGSAVYACTAGRAVCVPGLPPASRCLRCSRA